MQNKVILYKFHFEFNCLIMFKNIVRSLFMFADFLIEIRNAIRDKFEIKMKN